MTHSDIKIVFCGFKMYCIKYQKTGPASLFFVLVFFTDMHSAQKWSTGDAM